MRSGKRGALVVFGGLLALPTACLSSTGLPPLLDAGARDASGATDGPSPSDSPGACVALGKAPALPDQSNLPAGALLVTASGESLAVLGYSFPAVNPGDPVFADGWEIRFDHFIATFDKISLWANPDMSTTDQSLHGPAVAQLDGPWAVDLTENGAAYPYLDGKEPGERAVAFAVLANENLAGGTAFPTDGTRLAVGFSAVVSTPYALNVNLGPEALCAYEAMIQNGCVAYYHGTATWKGDAGLCTSTAPSDAGVPEGGLEGHGQEPEFNNIPKTVVFDFCFKSPTSYINCDNQDNDPAMPFPGEPHARGIAFKANTYTVGEVTFHTDHPFWESTKHDTPARFDQFASRVTGGTGGAPNPAGGDGGVPTVHLEDTVGVDYTGFNDNQGNVLPWRTCDPNYVNPNGGSRVGQMHFDPVAVPHCTNGDGATGLCDYHDFSVYDQSTQGHWNGSDGLCFIRRNYPSPP